MAVISRAGGIQIHAGPRCLLWLPAYSRLLFSPLGRPLGVQTTILFPPPRLSYCVLFFHTAYYFRNPLIMLKKSIDTSASIHTLFSQRWSGVCFDPDRPVPHELLLSVAEAARWAPSCFGDEPWRFLVCSKAENPTAWNKAWDCLTEGNQAWCRYAPVLIITCTNTLLKRNGKPNAYHAYDAGAAAVSLCLQA